MTVYCIILEHSKWLINYSKQKRQTRCSLAVISTWLSIWELMCFIHAYRVQVQRIHVLFLRSAFKQLGCSQELLHFDRILNLLLITVPEETFPLRRPKIRHYQVGTAVKTPCGRRKNNSDPAVTDRADDDGANFYRGGQASDGNHTGWNKSPIYLLCKDAASCQPVTSTTSTLGRDKDGFLESSFVVDWRVVFAAPWRTLERLEPLSALDSFSVKEFH